MYAYDQNTNIILLVSYRIFGIPHVQNRTYFCIHQSIGNIMADLLNTFCRSRQAQSNLYLTIDETP